MSKLEQVAQQASEAISSNAMSFRRGATKTMLDESPTLTPEKADAALAFAKRPRGRPISDAPKCGAILTETKP